MTQKRYEYFGSRNIRNCLCCRKRIRVGERYILVSIKRGIQHVDVCPRNEKERT